MSRAAPLAAVASRVADLLLPATCVGCGREGDPVCPGCLPALHVRRDHPPGQAVGIPAELPAPLVQLEWCAPFTGIPRRALLELKYGGERRLAEPLGRALADRWRAAGAGGDLLVPVPVHRDRERERGFNQAALLARVAAGQLGLSVVDALVRTHATTRQHGLGRDERSANLAGAFAIVPRAAPALRGRWVVLVDDVVTTGSTLTGCATALVAGGALAVSAVALARER